MVRRERHLRRAHEVEVVLLEVVDVVGCLAEEPGALHGLRLDERGRDDGGEAPLGGLRHGQLGERELELRADTREEVEARAAHLRAALDVDRAEQRAELEVVARLEALRREVAGGSDLLEDHEVVLATGRGVGCRVGQRLEQRRELLAGRGLVGVGGLDLRAELLGAREERLLLLALRLRDLLAHRLLLAAQRLERGDGRATSLVGGDERVNEGGVLPAAPLRLSEGLGVVSQEPGVDHPVSLSVPAALSPSAVGRTRNSALR